MRLRVRRGDPVPLALPRIGGEGDPPPVGAGGDRVPVEVGAVLVEAADRVEELLPWAVRPHAGDEGRVAFVEEVSDELEQCRPRGDLQQGGGTEAAQGCGRVVEAHRPDRLIDPVAPVGDLRPDVLAGHRGDDRDAGFVVGDGAGHRFELGEDRLHEGGVAGDGDVERAVPHATGGQPGADVLDLVGAARDDGGRGAVEGCEGCVRAEQRRDGRLVRGHRHHRARLGQLPHEPAADAD